MFTFYLTESGAQLLANNTLNFTSAEAGFGAQAVPKKATKLEYTAATFPISGISRNGNQVTISFVLTNKTVGNYPLQEIGLFATTGSGTVLAVYGTDPNMEHIPSSSTPFETTYSVAIVISESETVTATLSSSSYLTQEQASELIKAHDEDDTAHENKFKKYAPIDSPNFTGAAKTAEGTDYNVKKLRNVLFGTSEPSSSTEWSNGDIYIQYTP